MKYFYTIALASVLGLSVAAQAKTKTQTTVQQSGANSTTTQQDSRMNRQHKKQQKSPYWGPKDYTYIQGNQAG